MRAIILAAGRGSRLKALTEERPKCLVPLAGRPLLHWQLEALRAAGLRDIAVVRGYRAETLAGLGLTTFDNPRWAETNMVVSLTCARPWLEAETCVVAYADIVYRAATVNALAASQAPLAITYDRQWRALWTARSADPLADAETFVLNTDGTVRDIGRRAASLDEIQGQYMGLLKFTPAGWAAVSAYLDTLTAEQRDRLDMTSLLQRLLGAGVSLAAVPVEGGWCEVDNAADLQVYETRLAAGEPWSHDWREPARSPAHG